MELLPYHLNFCEHDSTQLLQVKLSDNCVVPGILSTVSTAGKTNETLINRFWTSSSCKVTANILIPQG